MTSLRKFLTHETLRILPPKGIHSASWSFESLLPFTNPTELSCRFETKGRPNQLLVEVLQSSYHLLSFDKLLVEVKFKWINGTKVDFILEFVLKLSFFMSEQLLMCRTIKNLFLCTQARTASATFLWRSEGWHRSAWQDPWIGRFGCNGIYYDILGFSGSDRSHFSSWINCQNPGSQIWRVSVG